MPNDMYGDVWPKTWHIQFMSPNKSSERWTFLTCKSRGLRRGRRYCFQYHNLDVCSWMDETGVSRSSFHLGFSNIARSNCSRHDLGPRDQSYYVEAESIYHSNVLCSLLYYLAHWIRPFSAKGNIPLRGALLCQHPCLSIITQLPASAKKAIPFVSSVFGYPGLAAGLTVSSGAV